MFFTVIPSYQYTRKFGWNVGKPVQSQVVVKEDVCLLLAFPEIANVIIGTLHLIPVSNLKQTKLEVSLFAMFA